jgi:hypothetical protein
MSVREMGDKLTQLRQAFQSASTDLQALRRLNPEASIKSVSENGIRIRIWHGCFAFPWMSDEIEIPWDDAPRYFQDPIEFAAQFFGATRAEYLEWVEDGAPRCSATTKQGKLCKRVEGRYNMGFSELKSRHRKETCVKHS